MSSRDTSLCALKLSRLPNISQTGIPPTCWPDRGGGLPNPGRGGVCIRVVCPTPGRGLHPGSRRVRPTRGVCIQGGLPREVCIQEGSAQLQGVCPSQGVCLGGSASRRVCQGGSASSRGVCSIPPRSAYRGRVWAEPTCAQNDTQV